MTVISSTEREQKTFFAFTCIRNRNSDLSQVHLGELVRDLAVLVVVWIYLAHYLTHTHTHNVNAMQSKVRDWQPSVILLRAIWLKR